MIHQRQLTVVAAVCLLFAVHPFAWAADKLTVEDVIKGHDDAWYGSPAATPIVDGILPHQLPGGGWHKQYDINQPPAGEKKEKGWEAGTIDNYATYTELRILGKAYNAKPRPEVLDGFNRGFDFLLSMQFPNGGFPQRFPLPKDYGRHITLNDHAMPRVMDFLQEVATSEGYAFVDAARREKSRLAFARAVEITLKLQIKRDGKLTGWAQQYDAETLQPTNARTYELPSLATDETVGMVRMLMRIQNPSPEVRTAIKSAVEWLEASKLTGIRLEKKPDPSLPKGYDVFVVKDPAAPPIWARFYEIDTNKPFFCGRDGIKKYDLSEIEAERRSGYAWMRPYAATLPQEYAAWLAKHPETATSDK